MRSSAKPFQALPLARAATTSTTRDLAIASRLPPRATRRTRAVRALLARGATQARTTSSAAPGGPPAARLNHNCSGKHAGMLATLPRARLGDGGLPDAGHPHAAGECCAEVAAAAGRGRGEFPTARRRLRRRHLRAAARADGARCSRARAASKGAPVAAAMRAHPELIRGPGAPTRELMRALDGWTRRAARRACCARPARTALGVALKVEDGARPRRCGPRSPPSSAGSASTLPALRRAGRQQPRRARRTIAWP